MKPKNYGWNSAKLSEHLSLEQLEQMRQEVTNDPASQNPDHANGTSINLYTKSACRKLDSLAWAVTYKLKAKREQREAVQL